ncbi:hypothetical protein [Streptomyces sp. NPDC001927]
MIVSFMSSLLVGVLAGVLSRLTGTQVAGAVLYGGGAFIAWMTLCVTVLTALGLLGHPREDARADGQAD